MLFNNVHEDGFNITISTKATLHYTGLVSWEPPAIFRSFCPIDVQWVATISSAFLSTAHTLCKIQFPFDEQHCALKFGSWSYTGNLLDLELLEEGEVRALSHAAAGGGNGYQITEEGIDLSDYYPSV